MDNRYYFEKINSDNSVYIEGQEFAHLVKVRRGQVGDEIHAICLDGFDYILSITKIEKNKAICRIDGKEKNPSMIRPDITVYLASIKQEALKEALDSLTQLNAKEIAVFQSEYSNAKYSNEKTDKLKNNFIQYAKQCERADIPNLRFINFNNMIEELKTKDLNIFAYENANENFLSLKLENYKNKTISLIVGGEGGFSEKEVNLLDLCSKRVSMGKTILRAPVAVSCMFACVSSLLGVWER